MSTVEKQVCSLVQLLPLLLSASTLLFYTLSPYQKAFDMFQSLNATGTPLTALETFKPLVSLVASNNGGFKGSKSEEYFASGSTARFLAERV